MKIKIREFIRALQLLEDQITPDGVITLPKRSHDKIISATTFGAYIAREDIFFIQSEQDKICRLDILYHHPKTFIPSGCEGKPHKHQHIPEKLEIKLTKTETKDVTNEKPVRFE